MRSRYAQLILGLISFSESIFAPIITDPFLVALILADRARWLRHTLNTIVSSVVGGVVAFFLGALFFEVFGIWLLTTFGLESIFQSATQQLQQTNGFWFVFIGALTPIPYKLVALAGGFVSMPLWIFVVGSMVGRGIRFGLIGYLSYVFGPLAMQILRYRVNLIFLALLFIGLGYLGFKLL
jgi:membrane protein YqaA with SNARE-associated domain